MTIERARIVKKTRKKESPAKKQTKRVFETEERSAMKETILATLYPAIW